MNPELSSLSVSLGVFIAQTGSSPPMPTTVPDAYFTICFNINSEVGGVKRKLYHQ